MGLSDLPTLDASVHTLRPNAKPPKREKKSRRPIRRTAKPQAERDRITDVRNYVIGRERGRCRCCRFRQGQSMHELRPRSLGGKVSKRNSVWVCGDGVRGCHGYLQRHEIVDTPDSALGADALIYFRPCSQATADWMQIKRGERIESGPMSTYEEE